MKKNIKFNKKRTAGGRTGFRRWVINIIVFTFFVSAGLSFISESLLRNVEVLVAFIILILIVVIGIVFDIIGVAVTAADEKPFHSMASRKILGSKTSVKMIRNASRISNLCNDAIGDICGIISGAAGAIIVVKLSYISSGYEKTLLAIVMSAIISSITVGGKALSKHYAISQCNNIVFRLGYMLEKLKKTIGLNKN